MVDVSISHGICRKPPPIPKPCAAWLSTRIARRRSRQVTILLDEQNKVHRVRLHIVEFRALKVHPGPAVLGGAGHGAAPCAASARYRTTLAASKALDVIVGAKKLTPAAESCAA